jgi:hypothetical protein
VEKGVNLAPDKCLIISNKKILCKNLKTVSEHKKSIDFHEP